jgi:hypothetical protein
VSRPLFDLNFELAKLREENARIKEHNLALAVQVATLAVSETALTTVYSVGQGHWYESPIPNAPTAKLLKD